jgi:hypothetical protein
MMRTNGLIRCVSGPRQCKLSTSTVTTTDADTTSIQHEKNAAENISTVYRMTLFGFFCTNI